MKTNNHISRGRLYSLAAALVLVALLTIWGLPGNLAGNGQNYAISNAYAQRLSAIADTETPTYTPTPTNTNTPTNTPTPIIYTTPTGEPEFDILQYVVNNTNMYCQGPFGTPGHRYLTNCYPFMYGSHPTNGYVDGYSDGVAAQAAWQLRSDNAQAIYPIFSPVAYGIYPGYDAGNNNFPYAHYESYFYGGRWVMGAVSSDDTSFRGSPVIANAILQAARALGYLGPPIPTPTITPTVTPTVDPSHLCDLTVRTVVISCNPDGTEHWVATIRNKGPYTVDDTWTAELQIKYAGNGRFGTAFTLQGRSIFPPGDTLVSNDFPIIFPPDSNSSLRAEFTVDTFGRNCSSHARSNTIPVCVPSGP